VNKIAASATHFVKCSLFHAYSRITCSFQLSEHKQKLHIASSWHKSIFGYILRTDQEQFENP